jgi:hypothetical protein
MTREEVLEGMVISLLMMKSRDENSDNVHVLRYWFDKPFLESLVERYQVNVSRTEPKCIFLAKDAAGLRRFPGDTMPDRL